MSEAELSQGAFSTRVAADWPTRTIRSFETAGLLLLKNGFSAGEHRLGGAGVPHLRPFNVSEGGRISLGQIKTIEERPGLDGYALQAGDVLYNNTNSEELVGKCAYWSGLGGRHVVSNHMTIIRILANEDLDPKYLAFFLLWFWRTGAARQICRRHVNQASIGLERLRDVAVPYPATKEQRAVAGVLSKLQAAVELQDLTVTALKELKTATIAKLFREGLRGEPLKQTEIGEIPESWEVVALGDYCRISAGGTPARDRPEYWGGRIPWIKTGEINYRPIKSTEECITESGLANSAAKLLPLGTLLMAMYGQGVTRGRVAFLEVEAATNQACAALNPTDDLDSGFLYSYLCFAYDKVRGLGHGANQQNLSADLIRQIQLPLPPTREEQREMHSIVATIESRLEIAEASMRQRSSFFEVTLSQLMSGQLRVGSRTSEEQNGKASS